MIIVFLVSQPVAKKLNALKETLVITTGDNYVGQLRWTSKKSIT